MGIYKPVPQALPSLFAFIILYHTRIPITDEIISPFDLPASVDVEVCIQMKYWTIVSFLEPTSGTWFLGALTHWSRVFLRSSDHWDNL
jgi:hypothetical protein